MRTKPFIRSLAVFLALVLVLGCTGAAYAAPADGTYRGTGQGLKGAITLDVTVQDGKIASGTHMNLATLSVLFSM